jgi:predicted nucleic acid-binding protein
MRYVLDSCVAVKWFLAEPDSAKAIQVLDEFNRQIHELLAPDVFPIEVAHALSRAERRGLIQPPAGSQHLSDLLAFLPALHTSLTLLPRAYEISSQARIGVYDCLYVALAEREGCGFLTADDRLVRALGQTYPFIMLLDSI